MQISNINEAKEIQKAVEVKEKKSKNQVNSDKEKTEKWYKDMLDISQRARELYNQQLKDEDDDEDDSMMTQIKLIEIAKRISNGDKVPASDEKKLLEAEPDMYIAAKSASVLAVNKKHKKYKALFKDDKKAQIEEQIRAIEADFDSGKVSESADVSETDFEGEGR